MSKFGLFLLAALVAADARSGMVDLGSMMGGANVFTVSDFTSSASDVEGAIVSGGDVTIDGYSVNEKNAAAFNGYSIAAGGDIKLSNGAIHNGKTYAGGKTTFDGAAAAPDATARPVDFSAVSRGFYDLSRELSIVGATGMVDKIHDGVLVQGSGRGGVDVFHVSSDLLRDSVDWQLEGVMEGQTLIFNVSGERGAFGNGGASFDPLARYNVLFNFYEAKEVDVRGVIGTVLAPYAAVKAKSGSVKGNIIVDTWNSTVQVDAAHYFKPVELAGFREKPIAAMPAVRVQEAHLQAAAMPAAFTQAAYRPASSMSAAAMSDTDLTGLERPVAVPEPATLALVATGLCMLAWRLRRCA